MTCGRRAGRSRMPVPTWRPSPAKAMSDDGSHYIINGQKIWSTRAIFADWVSGCSAVRPAPAVTMACPTCWCRWMHRASPSADQALNGKQAFAEIFFDDVKVPVGQPNRRRRAGLARGHGHRRIRAWPAAALAGPLPGHRAQAGEPYQANRASADRDPSIRDAVCEPGWAPRPTLAAYHTVGRLAKGAKIGAEASTNKIVWSELDLKMHETAMRILGPRGELLTDAPTPGGSATGWTASCSPRPARSTPAPTKSSATSSPSACSAAEILRGEAMDFTFTEDQLTFREAVSRFLMTEAAPRCCGRSGKPTPGVPPSCAASSPSRASPPCRCRGLRRPGHGRCGLVPDDPGTGLLRDPRLPGRHRLRVCRPDCRTPCRQSRPGGAPRPHCRRQRAHCHRSSGQCAGGRRRHRRPAVAAPW
jgi:hypothetical protein